MITRTNFEKNELDDYLFYCQRLRYGGRWWQLGKNHLFELPISKNPRTALLSWQQYDRDYKETFRAIIEKAFQESIYLNN